ncbi:MAG: sulfite exporter TauE/SafE family protein [Chloroflexi bacterium]|nr:sulfite exporter TauE/SafE family protein [Chloroflexota bacterium]
MDFVTLLSGTSLLVGLAVIAGSLIKGITGFGFSLVTTPILLLILDPRTVVVLNLFLATIINVLILVQSWHTIDFKRIGPMSIACVIVTPLGAYILLLLTASTLKILIATVVVIFSIPLLLGFSRKFNSEGRSSLAFGIISGLLSASTSMSGPPVVLFAVNQGWPSDAIRSNLAAYFTLTTIVAIASLGVAHVITQKMLILTLGLVLPVLAGYFVANRIFPTVKADLFRKITIIVVIATAFVAVATELVKVL